MTTIITRAGKGSPLTNNEMDQNLINLNNDKLEVSVANSTFAPLASPAFTGVPTAPNPPAATNDTQIATTNFVQSNFVKKSGDTMTGTLHIDQIQAAGNTLHLTGTGGPGGGASIYLRDDDYAALPNTGQLNSGTQGVAQWDATGLQSTVAQGTAAGHLTRKDYVDGQIATRVSKSGDTMTGPLFITAQNSGQRTMHLASSPTDFNFKLTVYNGVMGGGAGTLVQQISSVYEGVGVVGEINFRRGGSSGPGSIGIGFTGAASGGADAVQFSPGGIQLSTSGSDATYGNYLLASAPSYPSAAAFRGRHVAGVWVGASIIADNTAEFSFRADGNAYAPVAWLPASDGRVKKDRVKIGDAIAKVSALTGYTYGRSDVEGDKRYGGLIAQDVEAVLPEAVRISGGNENQPEDMRALDYNAVTALLVEAVKELSVKLDAAVAEIAALKAAQ